MLELLGQGTVLAKPASEPSEVTADAARVLWWLRFTYARNYVLSWIRGSRLRLCLLAFFGLLFWLVVFAIFFEAFYFLEHRVRLGAELTAYLHNIFYMSLTVMLAISAAVIGFHGLFRSRETEWLLQTCLADGQVFAYRLQDAVFLSSWGFLLLASPMLIAYGINVFAPWYYYLLFAPALVAYVFVPATTGVLLVLFLVQLAPRRAVRFGFVLCGVVVLAALVWGYRMLMATPGEAFSEDWLDALMIRLRFCQQPLAPSYWIAEQLLALARGDLRRFLFFHGVVLANAAMLYVLAVAIAGVMYRSAYSRSQSHRTRKFVRREERFERFLHRCFFFTEPGGRLLLLKDLKVFVRDPAQWSQLLIFVGLLALYFINVRRLRYDEQAVYWRNAISLLNLTVSALIMATFTSRFVFPLVSLEGKKLWVLGLLPLKRDTILWAKFAYSAVISLLASGSLVLLSDLMLRLAGWLVVLHMLITGLLCLGLSGISVGLGARLVDLREVDPSRIAAGFGGTLNLVVSLAYIVVIVLLTAIPSHLYLAGADTSRLYRASFSMEQFRFWLATCLAASVVISLMAMYIPMRMGLRHFRQLEV